MHQIIYSPFKMNRILTTTKQKKFSMCRCVNLHAAQLKMSNDTKAKPKTSLYKVKIQCDLGAHLNSKTAPASPNKKNIK